MANRVEVVFEIDKDSQGRIALRQIDTGIDQVGKTARQSGSQIESSFSFLKSAVIVEFFRRGATAAFDFGRQAVQAFNEANAAALGLQSVAQFKGIAGGDAVAAVRGLDLVKSGLLGIADASTALKNLLASGFSLPQAIELISRFGDTAAFGRQSALSFGQAITSATEGIKNGNSVLVDNAGVTKNLSVILKEAGFELQDLSDKTKGAAAVQALYTGLIKETQAQVGDAGKLAGTFAGQIAKIEAEQTKLLQTLGQLIVSNPKLAEAFQSIGKAIATITKELGDADSELRKFVDGQVTQFATVANAVAKTVKAVESLALAYRSLQAAGIIGVTAGITTFLTAGDRRGRTAVDAIDVNLGTGGRSAANQSLINDLQIQQSLLDRQVKTYAEIDAAAKREAETVKKAAAERQSLFQTTLDQASRLNSLRLQLAQLQSRGDPEKLGQASRDARGAEIRTAQDFLTRAETAAQKQFALERILSATSDVGVLTDTERGVRQKALTDSIAIQTQVFEENFKRLGDQTNATQENTAGLRAVGNSLQQVDASLANFAQKPITIVVEDASNNFEVDLGTI